MREILRHHQSDIMLRRLSLVDQHHLGRVELRNLAHHLTTDTTCRTRYQHTLSLHLALHGMQVHLDLIARQQVLNLHLAQLRRIDITLSVPLHGRVHGIDLHARIDQAVDHGRVIAERFLLER